LHIWYRVVYIGIGIGDVGVFLEFFLGGINEIYDFLPKIAIYEGRAYKNI
jgi:hypothetical protein